MNLDAVTIIAHVLNVVILFFFLRWLLYKPVKKYIDARSAAFDERRETLASQEKQVEEQKLKYEKLMESTHNEANEIVKQARDNANMRAQAIIDEAKKTSKELMAHTRAEVAAEREAAQVRMREEVAELAVDIAARVLEREVSKADNERIIESFFTRERIG